MPFRTKKNAKYLPVILDILSREKNLSLSINQLCDKFGSLNIEVPKSPGRTVKKEISKALKIGQSMGIIFTKNEIVRIPFGYSYKQCNKTRPSVVPIRKSSFKNGRGKIINQSTNIVLRIASRLIARSERSAVSINNSKCFLRCKDNWRNNSIQPW